tara:strand:- start:174 stop:674 length:501 start_codon:yes stop_codon:yes gene_type:complete
MKDSTVDIPSFIKKNFYVFSYQIIDINKLFVQVINSKTGKIKYLNIKKTPHYFLALDYLKTSKIIDAHGYKKYQNYIKSNPDDPRSIAKFESLINSIKTNGYNFEESPILVFNTLKRPLPLGRYDVADGFHRLSILAAIGIKNINVAVLKRKQSFITRLINRIINA